MNKHITRLTIFLLGVLMGFIPGCQKTQSADLVLLSGKIVTLEKSAPVVEALAVKGDRIMALGSDSRIKPYIGAASRVIDLHGKLAIPGIRKIVIKVFIA